MRSDEKLCFSVKKRGEVWKDYPEGIMNRENDLVHNVEGNALEGPVDCVCRDELVQALNEMKTVKDPGPSDVSLKLIAASSEVVI